MRGGPRTVAFITWAREYERAQAEQRVQARRAARERSERRMRLDEDVSQLAAEWAGEC